MDRNAYMPPGWWSRTRVHRYVFGAGMAVGIFFGWFFHGLISFVIQFGVVMILLLPLAVLAYMWWRSSRASRRTHATMTVVRWSPEEGSGFSRGAGRPFDPLHEREVIVDVGPAPRQERRR